MHDPYNLRRFVDAQAPVYTQVCSELRAGKKRGHWMWFIFPQIAGLGISPMSMQFAISSRQEATAYLEHCVLGPRLRECTQLVINSHGRSSEEIFGPIDSLKFRSSMTLFATVASDKKPFVAALGQFYEGELDPLTIKLL